MKMSDRESAINLCSEMDEHELVAMRKVIAENKFTGPHLEIGTAAGGTLREILKCYDKERPSFVVIDPFSYFPNQLDIVLRNLKESGLSADGIEFRKGYSWPECEKALNNKERYDFILIDGHHGFKHVMQDLRWTRMLNVGGVVCLHDYGSRFPGVAWAGDKFLQKYPNYKVIEHTGTLFVLKKSAEGSSEVSWLDILHADIVRKLYIFKKSFRKRLGLKPSSVSG